jgi:Icc-related predicted phosphoesterase
VWIAAGGDLHLAPATKVAALQAELRAAASAADLVLLAGDLTTQGHPSEAAALAEVCADVGAPVVCVLGNHDRTFDEGRAVAAALRGSGAIVLDPGSHVIEVDGRWVGVAGVTGCGGGFGSGGRGAVGRGDRSSRRAAADAAAQLDDALGAIGHCSVRIALMHYSPTVETLVGEQPHLWPALGSERLAVPIHHQRPSLVIHAHAHEGSPRGSVGEVPVLNVSAPVLGRPLALIDVAS